MENSRAVSRKDASTEGVIGKSCTACFAASIRIRQLAILTVMVNFGVNGMLSAVSRKWLIAVIVPLNCR